MNYVREHWGYLTAPGFYPGIDLLRALAVSLVLLFHFAFFQVGWVGVDLFFVISGFLIGGTIIDKAVSRRFSMREFYWHRALRILPIYYFVMVLCAIFKASGSFDWAALKSVLTGMFFLQTAGPYYFPEFFQINLAYIPGGSWSLAIEEIFYLIAPVSLLAFIFIGKGRLGVVAILVGLVVLSGPFTRLLMTADFAPDDPNWHWASFVQFHSRYDELAAGVLAACIVRLKPGVRFKSLWFIVFGLIVFSGFLVFMYQNPGYLIKPYTFTRETIWLPSVLAAFCMAFTLGSYWWSIRSKAIIFVARLSYPLYLIHIFVQEFYGARAGSEWALWVVGILGETWRSILLILISVFLAYMISLLVEYPFVRLYKRRKETLAPIQSRESFAS